MTMMENVPSDSWHLEFINGRNKRTVVGQQQPNDLKSVEILVANNGAVAVVIGKLQLRFHQQTVEHSETTATANTVVIIIIIIRLIMH